MIKLVINLFVLLTIEFLNIQCNNDTENEFHEFHRKLIKEMNVSYGEFAHNTLDIYYPDFYENLSPILVFVHGGGWCLGDKNAWDQKKADFFNQEGFISVSVNYRLSPYPFELNNPGRIQFPDHVSDLALAIKWIVDHAEMYGGDKRLIYLMGHSAGAQIVSLVAINERFLKEQGLGLDRLKGVISLDGGPYLTLDKELLFPPDNLSTDEYYKDIKYSYYNAFGFDTNVHQEASPYYNIKENKNIPPSLFVCQSITYRHRPNLQIYQKMLQYGYKASLIVVEDYDHGRIFDCVGSDYDPINMTQAIIRFLNDK
jgi:acetyl esterase/lipase